MEAVDTLLGYPIPFPKGDLYIAFTAVICFLPAVVVIHFIVSSIIGLFKKQKSA